MKLPDRFAIQACPRNPINSLSESSCDMVRHGDRLFGLELAG
jgi:hypothetical protein